MHRWILVFGLGLLGCAEPEPEPPGAPWEQRIDLPARRLEAGATANGSRLVVVGGFATSDREVPRLEITREILEYDPFTKEWETLPVLAPQSWTHTAVTGIGGSLYLLGGLVGEQFDADGRTYRLRRTDSEWTELEPMPIPRGAAAIVQTEGHVYLFGGANGAVQTASVLDYSIIENKWRELPSLPTPRSHAAAMRTVDDGTFIVAGGIGPQGVLGDVWALRPGGVWEPREPMPTARGGCAYGVVYGQLVCAGGEIGTTTTRVVEVYDPTLNTWATKPELPMERAGAASAVVTARLFVVGGSATNAFEPTSTLYEFDLLDTLPR